VKEILNMFQNETVCQKNKLKNVLVLAFIGDSIFTTFIRSKIIEMSNENSGSLHKKANFYVKASGQAIAYNTLIEKDYFDEVEKAIGKRARNCKLNHTAKNASLVEHRDATSLESIIGYLYLSEKNDRLFEMLENIYNILNEVK